jgi:tetratricopeptide (TPR) repeat protein
VPSAVRSRARTRALLLALAAALAAPAGAARQAAGQDSTAYQRAMLLEQQDKYREAAAAYREALAREPGHLPSLLGLERAYAQIGWTDSLLPVVERAIAARPEEASLRTVLLRTLRATGDDAGLRAAFDRWRREAPRDPAPYRELARLHLQDGRAAAADSVLRLAQAELGGARGVEMELAQLRAATGLWDLSAAAWRRAVEEQPYLDRAAMFSLVPAPAASRQAVIAALVGGPPSVHARRVAASLHLEWGEPRAGWDALRTLRPDTAVLSAWTEFASRAEEAQAWLVARDALAAVLARSRSVELALRAATAALNGGDSRSALQIAGSIPESGDAALAVLPVRLRALATLGRPDEAERALTEARERLTPEQRARLARTVAWAWVRAGDLQRARALLGAAGDEGEEPVYGWLALYEGDLRTARRLLRREGEAAPDLVTALALLARVRAERSPEAGRAFLLLARGDTAAAAAAFESAAAEIPEGAPLLLVTAARLHSARGEDARAIALWRVVTERHTDAPEAPEAELEWARALRRAGEPRAAIARLEHLILTYPQSALLPQARRELELARASVPPTP